jgi:hypothetical protein
MIKTITTYFGYAFLFCLLFGAGFYFGFKVADGRTNHDITATKAEIQALASSETGKSDQPKPTVKEIEGVFFILPGQKPECPETHLIKGKYDKTTGYFYAKSNKSYDKVVPLLCFANEEVAVSKGFLKKF